MNSPLEQLHELIERAWVNKNDTELVRRCKNLLDAKGDLDFFDFPYSMSDAEKRRIIELVLSQRKDSWPQTQGGVVAGLRVPAPVDGAGAQRDVYVGRHRFKKGKFPQARPSREGERS